jgi:hypothetical protein
LTKAIRGDSRRPPGGPDCQANARARGPGAWTGRMCQLPVRGAFRALDFGSRGILPLLLADNYNHTTNNPTTKTQSAQRTHKEIRGGPPAYRSLRAVGQSRPAAWRRCGCLCWQELPVEQGLLSSLPGRRSCPGRVELVGPDLTGLISGGGRFSRGLIIATMMVCY